MAEGVGCGAVKPVTVQYGGNVACNDCRQASVIEAVPLGFMRRILTALVDDPVTEGSSLIFQGYLSTIGDLSENRGGISTKVINGQRLTVISEHQQENGISSTEMLFDVC